MHIHKGYNYFKYLLIIILISIFGMTIWSAKYVGIFMIPVGIPFALAIFFISFPLLTVDNEGFNLERKYILSRMNTIESFKFEELKSIEYSPGKTDWAYITVLALFGSGGFGGNSKADQLIITRKK